jgi:hypothetical protein
MFGQAIFQKLFSFWCVYAAQVDHMVSLDQQTSGPVEGMSMQTGGGGWKFMQAKERILFFICSSNSVLSVKKWKHAIAPLNYHL